MRLPCYPLPHFCPRKLNMNQKAQGRGDMLYGEGGRRCYSEEYSEVAGKQGQALGAKSW